MDRRRFFRQLVGGAGVVSTGIAIPTRQPPSRYAEGDLVEITLGRLTYRWLGWERPFAMAVTWGAWITKLPDGRQFYFGTGGVGGEYQDGWALNATHREGWPWLTPETFDQHAADSKQRALEALLIMAEGARG